MIHRHAEMTRMRPVGMFDVQEIVEELDAHPQFWNLYTYRTHKKSPHRDVDDIWVRYNAIKNVGPAFNDEHESEWYPCAACLPKLRHFIEEFALSQGASHIGGVLITRIPAGKQVHWHADSGWHAESHRKYVVCLKANLDQMFAFEAESLRADSGECFEFDNLHPHSVLNGSDKERVSLIISLRGFHGAL